jgi:hypothetical protein
VMDGNIFFLLHQYFSSAAQLKSLLPQSLCCLLKVTNWYVGGLYYSPTSDLKLLLAYIDWINHTIPHELSCLKKGILN